MVPATSRQWILTIPIITSSQIPRMSHQSEIVAATSRMLSLQSSLEIPIVTSSLSTLRLAHLSQGEHQEADKDQIYDIDDRNPHWSMHFEVAGGDGKSSGLEVAFSKMGLLDLFEKLEEIQEKLDSYS